MDVCNDDVAVAERDCGRAAGVREEEGRRDDVPDDGFVIERRQYFESLSIRKDMPEVEVTKGI